MRMLMPCCPVFSPMIDFQALFTLGIKDSSLWVVSVKIPSQMEVASQRTQKLYLCEFSNWILVSDDCLEER